MGIEKETSKTDSPPPTVFLSYSHDSDEHKTWVRDLAQELREKGVNASLDQWDLLPGADVTTFMEAGIRDSDRVLIICTPKYARKADGGHGGVAYEKMIVTGELYQDLGSVKFIPIVKEGDDEEALPSFLKTRYYIDFRDKKNRARNMDDLLRVLHDVPPNTKPKIGPYPFGEVPERQTGTVLLKRGITNLGEVPPLTLEGSAEELYKLCQNLLSTQDPIAWHTIVKKARGWINAHLDDTVRDLERHVSENPADAEGMVTKGMQLVLPLIVIYLSAIECNQDPRMDRQAIMNRLLNIPNWPKSGATIIVELPLTFAYVFHHWHGATCLATSQIGTALDLATTMLRMPYDRRPRPLWRHATVIGWPSSLNGNCESGWDYLKHSLGSFPWLKNIFVTEHDYQAALTAYSIALSALELGYSLQHESFRGALEREDEMTLDIPPMFLVCDQEVLGKAFTTVFPNATAVSDLAVRTGVTTEVIRDAWPKWLNATVNFLSPHHIPWLYRVSNYLVLP